MLLPKRLVEVVPLLCKALVYDVKSGSTSVGSNIRDAAAFVAWSFARAYDPKELEPYVAKIASYLLIATVFDREVRSET